MIKPFTVWKKSDDKEKVVSRADTVCFFCNKLHITFNVPWNQLPAVGLGVGVGVGLGVSNFVGLGVC